MATKSFIKTIGEKGLLADYNTEGKKLQTELTAGDNITIDGNTISSDQIFVATYGTTKYAEVKAAFDSGKLCTVFFDNNYYFIKSITTSNISFASLILKERLFSLTLSKKDVWSNYNIALQSRLTFDSAPTAGSKNPVTSDGIKKAIDVVGTDINNLTDTVNNHTTQIGGLQTEVESIESSLANKKDKQTDLNFNGSATKTVKTITQDANGVINVEYEDIDLLIHDGDISKSVFTDKLDGNGLTPVVSTFYARPNTTICVVLDKVDWHVTGIGAAQYKFVIRYRKASDYSLSNIIGLEDPNLIDNNYFIKVPSDAVLMEIFIRMDAGESLTYSVYPTPDKSENIDSRIAFVKAVNHRGYNTIAPENTLPAFRLSAKMGFGYVETDIQKSADGELVCIHDYTVDRTSNGTGKVADMTLEQLKALDFGSWKSSAYAGTKIPTFAEFLVCCRNLGLHAYIELKIGGIAQQLVQMVEAYGMKNHVTYICFNESILQTILPYDPKARIGLLRNHVTADDITWVNNHKTTENEIFIDAVYANAENAVALCKSANIALEVWDITRSRISKVDEYISGFTANNVDASIVKYGEELLK